MKVAQLIEKLSKLDPSLEVAILDGFNGGGSPRTINYGPLMWDKEDIEESIQLDDELDYSDLNSKSGTPIVLMGFGCY